jgi:hypothetical protein
MSDDVYRQHLEKLGEDVVRHRLLNRMAIGDRPENNPPYEFVHIWLGAKVAKRRRAENWRYGIILTVAVISAIAAVMAAWPAIILRRYGGDKRTLNALWPPSPTNPQ